jgi:hypothetical protein
MRRFSAKRLDSQGDSIKEFGVVPVPTNTFYVHHGFGKRIARFTYCQRRETLEMVALEFLCASQAIASQLGKRGNRKLQPGAGAPAALDVLKAAGIAALTQDRVLYPDIRKAIRMVRSGQLLRAARAATTEASPC